MDAVRKGTLQAPQRSQRTVRAYLLAIGAPAVALLVRHALGLPGSDLERESQAAGVMMVPVPASGVLEEVAGDPEHLVETERRREPEGKGSLRGLHAWLLIAWSALGAVGAVLLWGVW